jgi:hypothetical protein
MAEATAGEDERRRAPRLAVRFPVTVRGNGSKGKRFQYVTHVDNLSRDGLHVVLPAGPPCGARVFALVRMSALSPPAGARLAVRGVVAWSAPRPDGCFGVGVRFDRWRFV